MARIHSSFSRKLTTVMNARIDRAYQDFEKYVVWAGIHGEGNQKVAEYARWNHYGHFCGKDGSRGYAQARPFLRASTIGADSAKKIAQIIKTRITESRSESWERVWGTDRAGKPVSDVERTEFRTKTFPVGAGNQDYNKYNSPQMIMRALGKQMAQNQRDRITSWGFAPNTQSTRIKKGLDKPPLVDTGKLLKTIDGGIISVEND